MHSRRWQTLVNKSEKINAWAEPRFPLTLVVSLRLHARSISLSALVATRRCQFDLFELICESRCDACWMRVMRLINPGFGDALHIISPSSALARAM